MQYQNPTRSDLNSTSGLVNYATNQGSSLSVAPSGLLEFWRNLTHDLGYFSSLQQQYATQLQVAQIGAGGNRMEAQARMAAIQAEAQATAAKIGVEREQVEVMKQQIASQSANSAADRAATLQGLQMQLAQSAMQFAAQMGFNQQQLAETMRQFNISESGYFPGGQQTLGAQNQAFSQQAQTAELLANPRTFIQGLMTQGLSAEDATRYLNALPEVQQLTGGTGPSLAQAFPNGLPFAAPAQTTTATGGTGTGGAGGFPELPPIQMPDFSGLFASLAAPAGGGTSAAPPAMNAQQYVNQSSGYYQGGAGIATPGPAWTPGSPGMANDAVNTGGGFSTSRPVAGSTRPGDQPYQNGYGPRGASQQAPQGGGAPAPQQVAMPGNPGAISQMFPGPSTVAPTPIAGGISMNPAVVPGYAYSPAYGSMAGATSGYQTGNSPQNPNTPGGGMTASEFARQQARGGGYTPSYDMYGRRVADRGLAYVDQDGPVNLQQGEMVLDPQNAAAERTQRGWPSLPVPTTANPAMPRSAPLMSAAPSVQPTVQTGGMGGMTTPALPSQGVAQTGGTGGMTTPALPNLTYQGFASAFGSTPGMPNWNPAYDFTGDSRITPADFSIYKQTYPQVQTGSGGMPTPALPIQPAVQTGGQGGMPAPALPVQPSVQTGGGGWSNPQLPIQPTAYTLSAPVPALPNAPTVQTGGTGAPVNPTLPTAPVAYSPAMWEPAFAQNGLTNEAPLSAGEMTNLANLSGQYSTLGQPAQVATRWLLARLLRNQQTLTDAAGNPLPAPTLGGTPTGGAGVGGGTGVGVPIPGGGAVPSGVPTPPGLGPRNPAFPFISGRALPVGRTLAQIRTQSPMIPFLAGLASYSGQTPESFFGDFMEALPRGGSVPLTGFR